MRSWCKFFLRLLAPGSPFSSMAGPKELEWHQENWERIFPHNFTRGSSSRTVAASGSPDAMLLKPKDPGMSTRSALTSSSTQWSATFLLTAPSSVEEEAEVSLV